MDVLTNLIISDLTKSFCNIYMCQVITLYTLNLRNVTCQLSLNKAKVEGTASPLHYHKQV